MLLGLSNPLLSLAVILNIVVNLPLVFKSSGVAGLIYVNFAKVGFLLKFILNGKSKMITDTLLIKRYNPKKYNSYEKLFSF